MRTRHDHLRAPQLAPDGDHVDLDAFAVRILLPRHLLRLGHDGFERTEIDPNGAGVTIGLDDTGQDVSLRPGEMAVFLVILRLPNSLEDHLTGRRGSHSPEISRSVVVEADDVVVVVELRCQDRYPPRLAVYLDLYPAKRVVGLLISIQQCILKGFDEVVHRNFLVALDGAQSCQIDVHVRPPPRSRPPRPAGRIPSGG